MNKKKLLQELIKLQNLDNPNTIFSLLESSPEFSYFLFKEKDSDYIEYLQWLVSRRTNLYSGKDYKYWFVDIARLCGFYFDVIKWKHTYIKGLEVDSNDDGDIAIYFNKKAVVCLFCQEQDHSYIRILKGVNIISTEMEFLDEILKFIKNEQKDTNQESY